MSEMNLVAEPGKQEIVITCIFDAPRTLVWKTYTDPDRIPHWWGPKYLMTTVEMMEVKPGGVWRFIQRDGSGNEYAFKGVYHAVVPPGRLVYTFEFEGMPGHVSLETITFEEQDAKTKMIDQLVFQSVEDRDGMLESGMEAGSRESIERFVEFLAKS